MQWQKHLILKFIETFTKQTKKTVTKQRKGTARTWRQEDLVDKKHGFIYPKGLTETETIVIVENCNLV